MVSAESGAGHTNARRVKGFLQVAFILLQPQLLFSFQAFFLKLGVVFFQLFCIFLRLANGLCTGAFAMFVELNRVFHLVTDNASISRICCILKVLGGLFDCVNCYLGHFLPDSDPCIIVLLSCILDPLVLRWQSRQILGISTAVLHQPIHLSLFLLIGVLECWIMEHRWVQAGWPRGLLWSSVSNRPLFQATQCCICILFAAFQVVGTQPCKAPVGIHYGAF
mmetsp:Transcript_58096/g.106890  ORF Transcript_58096/g.106890 Transcript_58096/m.106890 type:complete len:222 (+) Transcript_58096:918-1583(+)